MKLYEINFMKFRVLLVAIALFVGSLCSYGQTSGIYESYVVIKPNGLGNTFYDLNAATANIDFQGANLGTFSQTQTLVLAGAQNKTFKCSGGNITGSNLYYRVYSVTAAAGSFSTAITMGFASNDAGGCGGNQTWQNISNTTDVKSGLVAGVYRLEVYTEATGTPTISYSNNGGSNYIATFTVTGGAMYDFTGATTGAVTTNTTGCTASVMISNNNNGTVIPISGATATVVYPANNIGNATPSGSLNIATSGYFEFSLTPPTSGSVVLNSISFGSRSTLSGPVSYSIRTSADGYATDIASGTILANSTWALFTPSITAVTGATNSALTIRIYGYNGSGAALNTIVWRLDDINIANSIIYNPYLTVSSSSLALSSSQLVGTQSTSQTFNLSGFSLTGSPGNITVTAPNTNYQVSNNNATWGATTTIAYGSATLASTAVYVRFTPQSSGAKTGNITFSGGGTSGNPTIALSGTGLLSAPVATNATSIASTSFDANWAVVANATSGYLLDVSTSPTFSATIPINLTEGFAGMTTPPAGWSFSGTGFSTYISGGNFGVASPSLLMNTTGQQVITSLLSGSATQLSFWLKGNGTDASSALLVEAFNGTTWAIIQNITANIPTTGTTFTFNSGTTPTLPTNIIQFRFTYTKSAGNIAFDDVSINSVYNAKPIIGQSTITSSVTGLTANTLYYYRLRATDGSPSPYSNVVGVYTGSILSNQIICNNSQPNDLILSGTSSNYGSVLKWQKSSDVAFTTPTDIASTSSTLTSATIGTLTATTYFRAMVQNGGANPTAYSANVTVTAVGQLNWANLQSPSASTICSNEDFTAYGQVYQPGVTPGAGVQGAGITVEFGFSTNNTDPSTWANANWFAASFNPINFVNIVNNDEYLYTFIPPSSGTFYYTFRYKSGTCNWQYGGYNSSGGGFWNGTANVNGVVTVNSTIAISLVTPTSGPIGTQVTINAASGLSGVTSITFNGVPATVVSSTDTQMLVTVPAAATVGNIVITNSSGCVTTNPFTLTTNFTSSCEGGTVASDLFISEVTDSTTGGLSYIEIYNGTASSINLSGYSLKVYSNGDTLSPSTLPLNNVVINSNSVYVVASGVVVSPTDSNSCLIIGGNGSLANQPSGVSGINFEVGKNDYIGLYKNSSSSFIDSFGSFGSVNWADGLGLGDRGATFRRKNIATLPNLTFSSSDWNILNWAGQGKNSCSSNNYSDIGIYNFLAGTPPTVTQHPSYTPTCKATSLTIAGAEGFAGGNTLTYQWYTVAPNATSWTALTNTVVYTGSTSATLNILDVSSLIGYQYYCQIRENTATCYSASNAVIITTVPSTTWQSGSTWSNGYPTTSTVAVINNNYDTATHGSFDACSLVVNSPYTAIISSNDYINIQYDLTVNLGGNLIVQNNGSLVQIDDNGVNTGIISMQRTPIILRSTDYIYWSSPVSNFPVAQVSPASWLIYRWIPTISRTPLASNFGGWLACYGDTMLAGKGYIIRGLDTVTATFTNDATHGSGVVNNGIINVGIESSTYDGLDYTYVSGTKTLTVNKDNDNYNLLGNPYASAIDAVTFLTLNSNIEGHVRLWSHGTAISASNGQSFYNGFVLTYSASDYVFYNKLGTSTGPQTFNGKIAAGQGFFVTMNHSPTVTSGNITFNNSMRNKGYNNSNFFKTSNASKPSRIWLDITNDTGSSIRTLVGYDKEATTEKDRMYDAKINVDSNLNIYSLIDTEPQIIQGRPMPFDKDDKVSLGIVVPAKSSNSASSASTYKIGIAFVDGIFNKDNQDVFLEDKLLNNIHDLRKEPYVFTSNAGRFDNRFVLRYTNTSLGINDFNSSKNNVIVATSDAQIKVKSNKENIKSVTVYDVLGREIYNKENINFRELNIKEIKASQQALIIKVVLENNQIVSKKIIF